jgi:hypothetical protein
MMQLLAALLRRFGLLTTATLPRPRAQQRRRMSRVRGQQGSAFAGNVRSLRDIERRVLPTMPGMQYLGPEYDPAAWPTG